MKWMKYGVTLSRIKESDIELIRHWRNHPRINAVMQFREQITEEMQRKWFDSVNNIHNFYYLIEYNQCKIGLINNKNVNWKDRTSEAGIFIWDETYEMAPVLSSILLCEIGFVIFQGGDSWISVLKSNKPAIQYNKLLGYEVCKDDLDSEMINMKLTRVNFERSTQKIRKTALKMTGNNPELILVLEKHDYDTGLAQFIEEIERDLPLQFTTEFNNGEKTYYCSY